MRRLFKLADEFDNSESSPACGGDRSGVGGIAHRRRAARELRRQRSA